MTIFVAHAMLFYAMRRRKPSTLRKTKKSQSSRLPETADDLDATDLKIISHLQENGRATNIEIARAIGVAEATVRRRIDRLMGTSIVKVVAVLNPTKTGYLTDAIIGISTERTKLTAVGEKLARLQEVVYVSYTTGLYDIIIEVLLRSDAELFRFLTEQLSRVVGIRSAVTFHVLRTAKINYDWKLPLDVLTSTPALGDGRVGDARN